MIIIIVIIVVVVVVVVWLILSTLLIRGLRAYLEDEDFLLDIACWTWEVAPILLSLLLMKIML